MERALRDRQAQLIGPWIAAIGGPGEFARRAAVSPTWITKKLNDPARFLRWEDYQVVDRGLRAAGAALGILHGIAISGALQPDCFWEYNSPDTAVAPMFAWIQAEHHGPMSVEVRWGVFTARADIEIDERGHILTCPIRLRNPPIRVETDRPSWVSFASGVAPGALNIPTSDGLRLLAFKSEPTHSTSLVLSTLRTVARLAPTPVKTLVHRFRIGRLITSARSDGLESRQPPETPATALPVALNMRELDINALRALTQTLGLSERRVAQLATRELGVHITRERVRRLGHAPTTEPRDRLLGPWIDRICQADGRLACVEMPSRTSPVNFPLWWQGPVWIRALDPCDVRLTWGDYSKEVRFPASNTACWTRCADPSDPLHFETSPPGSRLVFGLGRLSGAGDINEFWRPASESAARRIRRLTYTLATGTVTQLKRGRRSQPRSG